MRLAAKIIIPILSASIICWFFINKNVDEVSRVTQDFEEHLKKEESAAPAIASKNTANNSAKSGPKGVTITWKRLSKMDYLTGKIPASVKQLESKIIRIPGFIVPLTDDWDTFDEFLIVPDPQACIHVPAPPPNQILYVKTKKKLPASLMYYPLWFQGKLKIVNTDSDFGRTGYQLTLQRMEIYKDERVAR